MSQANNIAGLGARSDYVAVVPTTARLSGEERRVLECVGQAATIAEVISRAGLAEARAIALLLALRAKGAIVPAKVQRSPLGPLDAALGEEVDLEPERKREILELERALDRTDHFGVFGLTPEATPDEVRRAYHDASRRYHPDRYFSKNMGSYRARIERIFRRLTEAKEVLTEPAKREAYLKEHPELAGAPGGAAERGGGRTPESEARAAERRARMARHPYLARARHAAQLLSECKALMAKGDYAKAHSELQHLTTQIDPQNKEAQQLLLEARQKQEVARAAMEAERARSAEAAGDLEKALEVYRHAASLDPKSAVAAAKTASVGLRMGQPAIELRSLAQRAVDLAPKNPSYRVLLGQILFEAGMKKLARRELEMALQLDASHAEAKALLRKLRWSF